MSRLNHFLAAVLITLCLPFAAAPPTAAAADVSLQISFGTSPHWVSVPGTRVRAIRMEDQTDYDVFQYGGRYYAYNHADGRWYVSRHSDGRYRVIEDHRLPKALRRVPRDHWRNYPSAWETSRSLQGDVRSGSGDDGVVISFGTSPQWTPIEGTDVRVMYVSGNPDYDVFRYGPAYYAFDGTRWYSSQSEGGRFVVVQESAVPGVFRQVPRERWHHQPPTWDNGH